MKLLVEIQDDVYQSLKNNRGTAIENVMAIAAVIDGQILPDGFEILTKEAYADLCMRASGQEPTTKRETLVSLDVYNQVAKERDIAIQQLHELGYEFGQKIEPTTKNLGVDVPDNNVGDIDCISRLDAIKAIQKYGVGCLDPDDFSPEQCERFVINKLNELSSVKLRKGQWLRMSGLSEKEDDRYQCSYCGNVVHYKSKMDLYTFNSWCGRCGSDNDYRNVSKESEVKE